MRSLDSIRTSHRRLHGTRLGRPEELLFDVVSRTSSVVGEPYFPALAQTLCDVLGCSAAFIVERPKSAPDTINPIAVAASDGAPHAEATPLAGSAAEESLSGTTSLHVAGARSAFPKDALLETLQAESCLIVSVRAASGTPNGFLGVTDIGKLEDPLTIEAVLRLVSPRVGAEIERLQVNQELQTQSDQSRAFMERAQDIIVRLRPGHTPVVEYANSAFGRLTGYPREDLYADPQLLLRIAHPDHRDDFAKMLLDGNTPRSNEWRWIRRDGSTLWTEGRRIFLYDDQGNVSTIETIARDITALKAAETAAAAARLLESVILEAVPDTVLRVDRAGTVTGGTSHKNVSILFAGRELAGSLLVDLLPADAAPEIMRHLGIASVSGMLETYRFEVRGGGSDRAFEARIAPVDSEQAVIFFRDITGQDFLMNAAERERSREELVGKAERRILRQNPYGLTFREFTVLELVAAGLTDKQIAHRLGISLNTVGKHVSNILGKMQVSSRTEASVRAVQEGLLD